MGEVTTIGLDLAKNIFQVHGVDEIGTAILIKRNCPGSLGALCQTERIDQDLGLLSDGLDYIPVLFFGSRDEGTDDRKVGCSVLATEAAGDFLLNLHHAHVAFGLIVAEGDRKS